MKYLGSFRPSAFAILLLGACRSPGSASSSGDGGRFLSSPLATIRTIEVRAADIQGRRFVLTTTVAEARGQQTYTLKVTGDDAILVMGRSSPAAVAIEGAVITFGEYHLTVTNQPGRFLINDRPIAVEAGLKYVLSPTEGVSSVGIS